MKQARETINETLADAVMNRPREFFIGKTRKRLCLYPPSLGASLLISRHVNVIGIDMELLRKNATVEALRIVGKKRIEACRIIALHTFRDRLSLEDSELVERRAKMLSKELDDEALGLLLMVIFTEPGAEEIMEQTGISEEQEEQSRIAAIKADEGHSRTFGGKTVFGTLIVPACERLNLKPEEAIWDYSLTFLRLALSDAINSVYLSDDEKALLGATSTGGKVYGMRKEDIESLKGMDWG